MRITIRTCALTLALMVAQAGAAAHAQPEAPPPRRFAAEIEAFVQQDEIKRPARCATLFVGSSTFRLWNNLDKDFRFPTIRRGFGGATIADINLWFDRIVAPYQPSRIVFYAGENDLAEGRSADLVFADFEEFLRKKDAALGSTPVWFVSAKPSPARAAQRGEQQALNARVLELAGQRSDLAFVDIGPAMLPRLAHYYGSDPLHMNPAGYGIWTRAINQALRTARLSKAPGCP